MSYTNPEDVFFWDSAKEQWSWTIQSPMVYDILAAQHLYGANWDYNVENTVYIFDPTEAVRKTIWDGGGKDTFDFSNFLLNVYVNLIPGSYSDIPIEDWNASQNIGIAFGAIIENVVGGFGDDYLSGNFTHNSISGSSGNDVLSGWEGDDILYGGVGQDSLFGDEGNDNLSGSAGDDRIYGGSGIDTAVFSGNQTSYTLTLSPIGTTITDRRTDGTGTDTLTSIEKLAFTDSTLDMNAFTGLTQLSSDQFKSLAEMYVAYFNRAPDAEGLFFWADQLAESLNMNEIAERFFDQAETRAIYTDPSNTDAFVTAVYANVLGRTPDEGGSTFWKARLAEGDVTQGAFVLTIIEAAKNVAGSSDAAYLSDKTDVGIYYSAIKGLSDGTDGRQVMAAFGDQETSNKLGAKTAIDGHYADATTGAEGEFLFNVVGVVSNPFAEFV